MLAGHSIDPWVCIHVCVCLSVCVYAFVYVTHNLKHTQLIEHTHTQESLYASEEDLLSTALTHLRSCSFVGIYEEFEKSLDLFEKMFGIETSEYATKLGKWLWIAVCVCVCVCMCVCVCVCVCVCMCAH